MVLLTIVEAPRWEDDVSDVSIDSHIVRQDIAADLHGDGACSDHPSRPVSVLGDEAPVEQSLGAGGRAIAKPFSSREEVGEIGILNANFGRERADASMREYTRRNLKTSPASVLALQEGQESLAEILEAEPVPMVVGHAHIAADASAADIYERPMARYLVVMGTEHGPTCLTAVRQSLAESITRLWWWWHLDGTYRSDHGRVPARSRILICEIVWRRPLANMTRLVHANVHMHNQTAKKAKGFDEAHNNFWRELFELIQRFDVRILSGDFNMSVFLVVSKLRQMGLIIDVGAIYAWRCQANGELRSDSCGIFLIGGCRSMKLQYDIGAFSETAASSSHGNGSSLELDEFMKGQGYALTSYLPKKNVASFGETLVDMFTPSVDLRPELKNTAGLLQKWKQKRIKKEMFDPNDEFFRSGAHMPLLGFLGEVSCRSDAKLLERELKRKEKSKARMLDRKSSAGKGKSKEKNGESFFSAASGDLHGDGVVPGDREVEAADEKVQMGASASSSTWTGGRRGGVDEERSDWWSHRSSWDGWWHNRTY
jgi:hypothetical protein